MANVPERPIDFLVRRRFPDLLPSAMALRYGASAAAVGFENALQRLVDIPPIAQGPEPSEEQRTSRAADIAAYKLELSLKTASEIAELAATEKQKEAAESRARAEFIERRRFFNQPEAEADFGHYCKCASWTLDEAIALPLGKNPETVHWKSVAPLVQVSPFAKTYSKRRDLALRAKGVYQLFDPIYPSIFLPWARRLGLPLPEKLISTAIASSISL